LGATIIIALMALALTPAPVLAGMKEAKAAYEAKDYKTAFKEYLPLAEAGNAEAQNKIGLMYYYAFGRERNYAKAVMWFKKAVNNGRIFSLISLGYMAGKGQGMKKSIAKRECYNRFAAIRGDETAQWALYFTLSDSFFTMKEAKKWLNRAIKQGQPNALGRQGALLILDPLNFDKTEGLMYLVLAQKYGDDPEVDEFIEETVADDSTRQKQLGKAKAMAAKWKPVKEIPPAGLPPIDLSKCENL